MSEEKDLNFLFNEMPLYTKEEFKVFELKNDAYELNDDEVDKFFKFIGFGQNRLITRCHLCKKEFPFIKERVLYEVVNGSMKNVNTFDLLQNTRNHEGLKMWANLRIADKVIQGIAPPYSKAFLLNNKIWYMDYFFSCTNDNTHNYILLVSIELKNGAFIVRKIGQNPSMLSVKGFDFDKYKKILEKIDAYDDYRKADLSNAEQFYVGAYAYLRRIFEKMITYFMKDKKVEDNHIETKIKTVKDSFDPRIKDLLKNLYGILSISIHELNEEQSKEYYIYLKTIIDMQLEYMQTENDKEKQTKSLNSIISKIKSDLNK